MSRLTLVTMLAGLVLTSLVPAARATITPSGALQIAQAIASPSANVTGASFVSQPGGTPNGVSTTALTGFPTDGSSFGVLTTGNVNSVGSTGTFASTGDGGGAVRGNTDQDVSILKIDLSVPSSANCLTFDFRFLSEEYPGYVGSNFNDAFIAELDSSTWTTSGSTISAPNNFAFDSSHNVVSINSTGIGGMSAANGAGTAFNGATTYGANGFPNPPQGDGPAGGATLLLHASRQVTPGAHSLYLSIFDQGDHLLDSAVFLDNLVVGFVSNPAVNCIPGAQPVDPPISATGKAVSATEGLTFSGQVAAFTDPDTSATAGEYAATIDWGDGAPTTAGTITGSAGSFIVSGSHVYADEGSKTVTVTITDVDNPANTATVTSTATIADAALTASGLSLVSPPAYTGPVATFQDANTTTSSVADFTATLDWGDGTPATSGTVIGSGGSYTVNGSHAYGSVGSFTIKVHVVDDGGSTADATTTILIFAFAAGGNFVIGNGEQALGHDVTFWGAQWSKVNDLAAGDAPAAFKGFEDTPATVTCGTSWSTDPGNSTPPPAGPLPSYMAVIVSSSIRESGSSISGNTLHMVVVKTSPGYAADPGHAGSGTVVAQIC
jgi:hypothetical protein